MGFGDSILATAEVRRAKDRFPGRDVVIGDGNRIHWCDVYENNPKISREVTPGCVWVRSWPGGRPYADNLKSTAKNLAFNAMFHVEPGEIFLTDQEKDWPQRDFVYIEPNVKREVFGDNKDWGFERWQQVVDRLPGVRFIQGRGLALRGVDQASTDSFRHACGLLSHADLFVGTSGGLQHAASALGKPAVIVWGGVDSPLHMGYEAHTNLHAGGKACGSYVPCAHCKRELDKISVDMVVRAIEKALA